jgi:hypothetical protein
MARFSQQMLAGLLNPAYQQELTSAARGLGQTPNIMRMARERKASQADLQRLLQENISNPAKLQQLANQYRAQGNEEAAEAFTTAATQATAKETTGRQRGVQGGLTAITQAAARGVPLQSDEKPDLSSAVSSVLAQGGTQAQIMSAYKAGVDMTKTQQRQTANVSPGGAIVDEQTGEVIYERPFKPADETASKGIKTVTREDGSVTVLDADDGSVISTLDAPGKGEGDRDASLNLIAQTTSFIQEINNLMDPGFSETGFIGGVTAAVPGTPAYDREKELLSIRARLGFDQINEMKRLAAESGASGTGLGQISNIEFMSLQSTIDAIYVGMSGEAQNDALANIKKHLLNVQKLASGVAPADAIDWKRPEYKAVGYHKDPDTGTVFYAPDGYNGKRYKLVNGKFQQLGRVPATPLGNTPVN